MGCLPIGSNGADQVYWHGSISKPTLGPGSGQRTSWRRLPGNWSIWRTHTAHPTTSPASSPTSSRC